MLSFVPSESERAWAVYGASKAQAEQAAWDFMKEQRPHFVFNSILPNANFGPVRAQYSTVLANSEF